MTKEEWDCVVWGAVAVAVLIPELLASFGMSFVPFPARGRRRTSRRGGRG
jgi:hypothetical protein